MKRRQILTVPSLLLLVTQDTAARAPTPAQTPGPFYPERRPEDDDGDLVQVTGQPRRAHGTVLHLSGRVVDPTGAPVVDSLVEIWQCDASGRYHHPGDRQNSAPDPAFQGFGHVHTDQDGAYRFRTIRPVPYPGRTPHIHFAVETAGAPRLVTQMYVRGEAGNEWDYIYKRIPAALRESVTVPLASAVSPEQGLSARFDIVLPG